MGPNLLFDKSFLQSLSIDEAAILDQLFCCIVTPVFFAETLGSLAKETKKGRSAEAIVRALAEKTPVAHSYMNSFHSRLMFHEMLGMHVEMKRRPAVAGGVPVMVEGKSGLVHQKSAETEAFERWQRGRFSEVERIIAAAWRDQLGSLDLPAIADAFKNLLRKEARPKSHEEAKALAQAIIESPGRKYQGLVLAYGLLGFPAAALKDVLEVWKASGRPPLSVYAPYTYFCLLVDIYFYLALSNGLISDQRASNKIDIGYLYYLPFVHVFASSDRLHRTAARLFLEPDQTFMWGPELKADLARLNESYLALPAAERARGLFTLVTQPPIDDAGQTAQLWDKVRPGWRVPKPPVPKLDPEQTRRIISGGKKFIEAAKGGTPDRFPMGFPRDDQLDSLLIERHIPRVRGSWRMFAPEVERAEDSQGEPD
jgi:hypothetical protein